jgi:hypothetical protein
MAVGPGRARPPPVPSEVAEEPDHRSRHAARLHPVAEDADQRRQQRGRGEDETATTSIAPSAIERRAPLPTIHSPASEITAIPQKATARPEVGSAPAGPHLLAEPGQDEERVVDRNPIPIIEAMLVTNTDISICREISQMRAPVTSTLVRSRPKGRTAAVMDPNTASRMRATIGKPLVSALARSSLLRSWSPAQAAPWPTVNAVIPLTSSPVSSSER